jgi:diaminohydroxyphosphoribosylaminopyrimidine deaminase / 5-amino-6-(5-phosphoribosylamino)uracil reductase
VNSRARQLLNKAFFEAERATWLYTAPNPRVGALAMKSGHIIGYGYHQQFGGPHAEVQALRDAGAWDPNANKAIAGVVDQMVVTLEPCSSTKGKKQPPCSQALLDAGVQQLLVGAVDPDPRHAGAGLSQLRQAGIQVEVAETWAQSRFEQQNPAFLAHLQYPTRPWILLKWAASLDGKTATDGGVSQWISGPESRQEVHDLRALSDAVLCGKGTLLADDPQLTARRSPEAYPRQPKRVMVGGLAEVQAEAKLFESSQPRIWACGLEDQLPTWLSLQFPDDVCLRVPGHDHGLDLSTLLQRLHQDFQVGRILVEGGAHLHGSLLQAGLLDAVVRYEAPTLMGGSFASYLGPSCQHPRQALSLEHEERRDLGKDLRRAFLVQRRSASPTTPDKSTEA